jgi:thiamine biosynthesis protein ThiS
MSQNQVTIRLNGETVAVDSDTTIAGLLAAKKIDPDTVVVERNRVILDKEAYGATAIDQHDEIEILRFVGGG